MELFRQYLEEKNRLTDKIRANELGQDAAAVQLADFVKVLLERQADLPEPPEDVLLAATVGGYLDARITGVKLSGAEAELNQGLNLGDDEIPLQLVLADAPTTVPVGIIREPEMPPAGELFASPVAQFLGVAETMVDPGQRDYIYLSASPAPSFEGEGDAVEAAAAGFAVVSANPTRLSMRFLFPNEAVSRMGPALEATLRDNLRESINAKLDENIIRGDGSGNQLNGLENRATVKQFAADATTQSTWQNYYDAIADGLDGAFADSMSDVRMIVSPACWKHARKQFGPSGEPVKSALEGMQMDGARVRMSKHAVLDLPCGNATGAIATATWIGKAGGFELAIWNSLRILRNEHTYDASDQVLLTGHLHCNLMNRPRLVAGSVIENPGLAEPSFVISGTC